MPKERTLNPATAQLKSDKARALKKSRAALAQQRTDRLATRNPDRLQQKLDELVQLKEAQGGKLKPRDQSALEQLERDVRLIRKARESKGVDANRSERDGPPRKRARVDTPQAENESEESTDEEVRGIPMPRDTPPPIPARRRVTENVGEKKKEVVKVISGEAQIRDLRKEATAAFLPAAVAARLRQRQAARGEGLDGRLLEPEEMDALEQGGYSGKEKSKASKAAVEDGDEEAALLRELQAEEERHRRAQAAGAVEEVNEEDRLARNGDQEIVAAALARGANEDATMAAQEAEKEELHALAAGDGQQGQSVGHALAESIMSDARGAAREAADEEILGRGLAEDKTVGKRRLVEVEDVSDDEW